MKKSPQRAAISAASPQVLADRGSEALLTGRFKEAMEVFKQLAKLDPKPEWTHRLADAYAGRARALAAKSMFQEAALVLENTRAPDGTVREPLLYLSCLIRQGQYQKALQAALRHADRLPVPEAARARECAAILSLAVPPRTDLPTTGPMAELTQAAQAALGAWLQGKPAGDVDQLLGGIPLRSPFGPLRLILKCLITPQADAAKAASLLAMIPADSMYAPARAAAQATLAEDRADLLAAWSGLRPAPRTFVAEIRGLPPAEATLLNQILDAERRGPAVLFALLIKPGLPLPPDDLRTACLNLLPAIPDQVNQFNRRFEPLSDVERGRVLALAAEASEDWLHARTRWDEVARALVRQSTPTSRLASAVALRHLADLVQGHPELSDDPWGGSVEEYLKRSLEDDPDHLPATLALLQRYKTDDDTKDWMEAAEAAAQRFPGNAAILLHAVDAAVARSAYKKAVGFARRLLAVDPINQPVRQRMIELQLAYARKQMRSNRADLAGKALSQAAEWERADTPSAPLRIGRALVALHGSPNAEPDAALREAVELAGGGTVGWFRAVLEAALIGWSEQRRKPLQRELAKAQTERPSREVILALVGMLAQKEIQDSKKAVASVQWRIEPSLIAGSHLVWSAMEFQTIAETLHQRGAFDVLLAYAREAMRRDPEDELAQFYRIVAQAKGKEDHLSAMQESDLYELMDKAGERQDFHMMNRVQRFMDGPETRPGGRPPALDELPDYLEDDEMEELIEMATSSLGSATGKEIRTLVNQFGRDRATAMVNEMMSGSPIGELLSDQQLVQLSEALVGRVAQGRAQHARR